MTYILASRLLAPGRRPKMKKGLLILAASLMMLAPVGAPAAARVFVGGPYYGGFYRPFCGPYWGPAYYEYPNAGEVKLDTKEKDAGVVINGAYAGTTHENRTVRLGQRLYKSAIDEDD